MIACRVLEQRNSHMKTVTDFGEFRKHLDEKVSEYPA